MSRPSPQSGSTQLLDRLRMQFPELSYDEVARAAAGVAALPMPETVPAARPAAPRHRA